MPAGARRSLASPAVVNGVLCQCGGVSPAAAASAASESASPSLAEHERRLYSLFVQLDVNRDGALCVHDLAVGLQRLGLHRSERDLWMPVPDGVLLIVMDEHGPYFFANAIREEGKIPENPNLSLGTAKLTDPLFLPFPCLDSSI